jgi:hypothetical protein
MRGAASFASLTYSGLHMRSANAPLRGQALKIILFPLISSPQRETSPARRKMRKA